MFQLKPLSTDRIPAALEKAERYRLLNDPVDAESICRDILLIEPEHQTALVYLVLALTDQFAQEHTGQFREACDIAGRLRDDYQKSYYLGIVYERRAKAHIGSGRPRSGEIAQDWFLKAMDCYEKAAARQPPDNDEALLRWNTCARFLMQHPRVPGPEDDRAPVELE